MTKTCPQCQTPFEITAAEQDFRHTISPIFNGKRYGIPEPRLCPSCRQQRRLAFRNEMNLYHRRCDKCGKNIVSVYSADKPLVVYCSDCWWGDGWSALSYGQDFDFNKPFYSQFAELTRKVPLLANSVFNSQNSEYCSFAVDCKDCYLTTRVQGEKILYSYLVLQSRDSVDCMNLFQSEGCYECIDCWNGYNLMFCQLCKNSSDSYFCYDCIGVKHCFGCIGLRNKEYHFFNKPCSKEDYEQYVKQYWNGSHAQLTKIRDKFYQEVILKNPQRAAYIVNSQNALGDYITNSKDVTMGFDVEKSESITHTWGSEYSKDVLDGSFIYYGEQCYDQISNSHSTNILFTFSAINNVHDILYSMMVYNNSGPAFGSISLSHQSYCILNKQYTKEDYEKLVPRIIEHMITTGEYGEFFPMELSPFCYNESVAQEYFPMTKEEVLKRGLRWKESEEKAVEGIDVSKLPDNIAELGDDICQQTLICEVTGRPFKIIPQELEFYRKKNLPLPRFHPMERKRQRMLKRNPRKLWDRACMNCQRKIQTSYSPDRPEIVYCEPCYLKNVY